MRNALVVVAALMALWLGSGSAQAEKRVALVIGNSRYQKVPELPNPERDAVAIGNLFRRMGFDRVDVKTDLNQTALRKALREFSEAVLDSDIAVVFYAGHGIEMNGSNYLIPTDAVLRSDIDVVDETVPLERVSEIIGPARRLRLVLVDACRDNPFAIRIKRTGGSRSIGLGLGKVELSTGDTLVAFAAKPGATAEDGDGRNSPYTTALLHSLATPGLEIRMAMGRVRDEVLTQTDRRQEPTIFGSLGGSEIILVPGKAGAEGAGAQPGVAQDKAERAWAAARDTTSVALLEEFIRRYGDSFYASVARTRIEELKKAQVAAAVPPAAPSAARTPPGSSALPCGSGAMTVSFSPSRAPCPLSAAEERSLKPKDVFRECDQGCPEMVVVPAGSFVMGSPEGEKGRQKEEGPQHEVTFAQPFAVGKIHVTVAQYAAFVKATGYDAGSSCYGVVGRKVGERKGWTWKNPGFAQGATHPAVCLNWQDAKDYVAWLSKETGKVYRLLTESEYEYSTRAGSRGRYSFGDDAAAMCRNGNGADRTMHAELRLSSRFTAVPCWDGFAWTSPGESFAANDFGLYDMHGNALSWVEDCANKSYNGAPEDGTAWMSGDCSRRMLRGGAWMADSSALRAASDSKCPPN
ncbi:MAG: SUMF1/EgtB/PvdO family nonheme iron enzyme [Alphaproteobacteria bacterium]|nr:SUMF1/EgtB/PvdO family nonheme iron enzyme [Alphaproteobacteria bacterium]